MNACILPSDRRMQANQFQPKSFVFWYRRPFISTHVSNLSFIIKISVFLYNAFFIRFRFSVQVSNIIYISLYFAKEVM